jgi:hypothetical protein
MHKDGSKVADVITSSIDQFYEKFLHCLVGSLQLDFSHSLKIKRGKCWTNGDVVFMPHTLLRQEERQINDPKVGQMIWEGFQEKSKDEYKENLKE